MLSKGRDNFDLHTRGTIYGPQVVKEFAAYIEAFAQELRQPDDTEDKQLADPYAVVPTPEQACVVLRISMSSMNRWAADADKPEWGELLERLNAVQATMLINKGLVKEYDATVTKRMLAKHGYREAIEHTGKDGAPLIPIDATMDPEVAARLYREHLKRV